MENTATYIHFFVYVQVGSTQFKAVSVRSEKTICAPTFIHSVHNKLIRFASPMCFYTAPLLTLSELRLSSLYLRLSFVYICLSFLYFYLSLCLVPTFIHSVHKLLPSAWALSFLHPCYCCRVCLSLSSLYAWLPFAYLCLSFLYFRLSFLVLYPELPLIYHAAIPTVFGCSSQQLQ